MVKIMLNLISVHQTLLFVCECETEKKWEIHGVHCGFFSILLAAQYADSKRMSFLEVKLLKKQQPKLTKACQEKPTGTFVAK